VAAVAGVLMVPPAARAANFTWQCTDEFWDVLSICWSPTGIPNATDSIVVKESNLGGDAIMRISSVTGAAQFTSVTVDTSLAVTAAIDLSGSGSLTTASEIIGSSGTGTFNQNGGTHTVNTNLTLGQNGTGTGIYNLNNGTLTVNGSILNGAGDGILRIDGGTLVVGAGNGSIDVDTLLIGTTGKTGSHTLSGTGSLTVAQTEAIGVGGTGTFTQNGGTHTTGSLSIGSSSGGGTGTYHLNGGSLATGGTSVGSQSTSTFNQNGGTHTADTLTLGQSGSTIGAYNLTAGNLQTTNSASLGATGNGYFTQSGGTHSVGTDLTLGQNSGGYGLYVLNGGTLTVNGNIVNGAGTGVIMLNSGSLSVGGGNGSIDVDTFWLGQALGSTVSHTLSGSGSITASSETIGYDGTGTFSQSGGSHTVNHDLTLGRSAGSSGTYNLSAGSLTTQQEYIGWDGTGTFNQDGGTHTVNTWLSLGENSFSSGTYNLNGGTLVLNGPLLNGVFNGAGTGLLNIDGGTLVMGGGGGSVDVDTLVLGSVSGKNGSHTLAGTTSLTAGTESIGAAGIGLFTQTGGTHTVINALYLGRNSGSFGGYDLNGGTLTVGGGLYVGGSDTAFGGSGVLTVNVGGSANVAGPLTLWNGTVNLNGGSLSVGTLVPYGGWLNFTAGTLNLTNSDLLVDPGGILGSDISLTSLRSLGVSGTTTLNGAGTLTLDGGTFSTGSLVNNGGFTFNSGTFNLTGDNLTIGSGGLFGSLAQFGSNQTVNVTNNATVNSGAVLALNGGSVSAGNLTNNGQIQLSGLFSTLGGSNLVNAGTISGVGRIDATLYNQPGAEVRIAAGESLRLTAAGNSNAGRIDVIGGSIEFDQGLVNQPSTGNIIARDATLRFNGGLDNQGSLGMSFGTSDVFGDINNTGMIIQSGGGQVTFYDDLINNGVIQTSSGSSAVFFGAVSGGGSYTGTGSLFFEGDLAPGNSPGMVSIGGDMSLGLNAHTIMEVAGLGRGTEYDAFDIGGTLALGGALDVVLYDLGIGLYAPQLGDSFDLFLADTITGNFDLLTLATLGGGLGWQLDILADAVGFTDVVRLSVVASAVPVPPAVWLFASGLLGLISVTRRRTAGCRA